MIVAWNIDCYAIEPERDGDGRHDLPISQFIFGYAVVDIGSKRVNSRLLCTAKLHKKRNLSDQTKLVRDNYGIDIAIGWHIMIDKFKEQTYRFNYNFKHKYKISFLLAYVYLDYKVNLVTR